MHTGRRACRKMSSCMCCVLVRGPKHARGVAGMRTLWCCMSHAHGLPASRSHSFSRDGDTFSARFHVNSTRQRALHAHPLATLVPVAPHGHGHGSCPPQPLRIECTTTYAVKHLNYAALPPPNLFSLRPPLSFALPSLPLLSLSLSRPTPCLSLSGPLSHGQDWLVFQFPFA